MDNRSIVKRSSSKDENLSKRDKLVIRALYAYEKATNKLKSIKQEAIYIGYAPQLAKYKILCKEMNSMEEFRKMKDGSIVFMSKASNEYLTKINRLFEESIKIQILFANQKDPEIRSMILRKLLGKIGEGTKVWPPFHCDLGMNIEMGENCMLNKGCTIHDSGKVIIGNEVLIGSGSIIATPQHGINPEDRYELYDVKPVVIKHNALINMGVKILPGVTIGEWSTVGAGSVVTKDIPPYTLAAGNPCRIIRKLTGEEIKSGKANREF